MGDEHERADRALPVLHRVGVDRARRVAVRGDAVGRDTSGAAAG